MKTKIAIAVILVFTVGMLLGWEIGLVSRQRDPDSTGLIAIVVATRDIPPGTRLEQPEKWLTKRMFLRESAPLDGFSRLGDLRGQLVRERVRAWEPCTARYLAHAVPIGIPMPGSRAVTVEIRDLAPHLANVITGSRADLIYTGPDFQTDQMSSVVFVENVMVLAVSPIQPATPAEKLQPRVNVTLAMAPADADRVMWAADHGTLTLVMRRPNDTAEPPG